MSAQDGLYLHVPFCSAICPYCDFAVTTGGRERRKRFTQALLEEIRSAASACAGQAFDTVYLGGGTPSALGDDQIGRILEVVEQELFVAAGGRSPAATVSIEANPEDVTADRARHWRSIGVGRLSLGVQSFDNDDLEFLGRRHSTLEAGRAVEVGLEAGHVVSIDLIYGLPGQSPESWRATLEQAVALGPHHLSCYQLTVEPGTPFARSVGRGDWAGPQHDTLADLFYLTHTLLAEAGYPAYEVSNFARGPECQCSHNRKYWEGLPYLGLGPSAHSFDGRSRWWNLRSEVAWRTRVEAGVSAEAGRERLSNRTRALERLMLGLRTPAGVNLDRLGIDVTELLETNRELLDRFAAERLLSVEDWRLVPTLDGMARADALARAIEL